ncbi:MAG: hypothetical protein U1F43_07345 [Myxococcota bacterium]
MPQELMPSAKSQPHAQAAPIEAPATAKRAGEPNGAPDDFAGAARQLEPNPGAQPVVKRLLDGGERDENTLTNEGFWAGHASLRDQHLKPGTPEAKAWLRVRDEVVRPALKAAARAKPAAPKSAEGATAKPQAPADAPRPTPPAVKGAASRNDVYLTQNDNSYDDALENFKNGAGANTCNMTSVTMALVSIAGEDKVRENMAALLRKKGFRAGAKVAVGHRAMPLEAVLKDPQLLAQVQLEDLVIAAAVKGENSFQAVTHHGAFARVAKASGLVKSAKLVGDKEQDLSKAGVREQAKEALARGQRLIAGTTGHIVYLTEVLDDGIVIHDPAGLRVANAGKEQFLHPGAPLQRGSEWVSRLGPADKRAIGLRRASTNPEVQAIIQRVAEIDAMKGKAKNQALEAWKHEGGGWVETGKANFYSLADIKAFDCRLIVSLEPGEKHDDEPQGAGKDPGKAPAR